VRAAVVEQHGLREAALLAQPEIIILPQLRDGMLRKE
jgi:hypothetical protein